MTRRARLGAVGVALVAVLSLTACGGSGGSNAAAADAEKPLLAFAQCMRDNGVPSFPGPVAKADGTFGFERPRGASSAALDQALKSCQSEARAAGVRIGAGAAEDPQAQDAVLGFAQCMRKGGVAEFPDPGPSGDFHALFDGIEFDSPRVQQAIQGCQSFLGQIFGHGG